MKKLLKPIWLVFTGVAFFSCITQIPIEKTAPRNNETYRVEYLFEHDGCKVYRFMDRGDYVYFTNCTGDVTSIKNDSTAARVQVRTYSER